MVIMQIYFGSPVPYSGVAHYDSNLQVISHGSLSSPTLDYFGRLIILVNSNLFCMGHHRHWQ